MRSTAVLVIGSIIFITSVVPLETSSICIWPILPAVSIIAEMDATKSLLSFAMVYLHFMVV